MRIWPRFVRTPWQWARDSLNAAGAFLALALIADLIHRASHSPWRCDESCPYPWGKRNAITDGLIGREQS